MKSVSPLIMMLILVVAQTEFITQSKAQAANTCASALTSLNICAPFVVPGGSAPNADCCNALQTVDRDCLCSTLRIASRMPAQCNLAPLSCSAN